MNRIYWLDATRAFAILLVVFTHAHEQAGISNEMLRSVFYSIDRLGVPLFFMISGGLILPRLSNTKMLYFYKKRIPQFIILLVIYSVITNSFMMYSLGNGVVDSFIFSLKNHNGIYPADYGGAAQMWFMYSIIGMYLIAPFLSKMVTNCSTIEIIYFIIVCILLNQLKTTLPLVGVEWGLLYRLGTDMTGPYLVFFLTGYVIINREKDLIKPLSNKLINTFLLILPITALIYIDTTNGKMNESLHWYSLSIFIYISSVGLLLLIKSVMKKSDNNIVISLSKASFGIYLSHYAFIYISVCIFGKQLNSMGEGPKAISLFYFSLICSYIFSILLSKNRITRYFVQ